MQANTSSIEALCQTVEHQGVQIDRLLNEGMPGWMTLSPERVHPVDSSTADWSPAGQSALSVDIDDIKERLGALEVRAGDLSTTTELSELTTGGPENALVGARWIGEQSHVQRLNGVDARLQAMDISLTSLSQYVEQQMSGLFGAVLTTPVARRLEPLPGVKDQEHGSLGKDSAGSFILLDEVPFHNMHISTRESSGPRDVFAVINDRFSCLMHEPFLVEPIGC